MSPLSSPPPSNDDEDDPDDMMCERCGGTLEYVGIDDGYGDYGTSACDVLKCQHCENTVIRNCIDTGDDDDE